MENYPRIIKVMRGNRTQAQIAEVLSIRYNVYQRYELGTAKMPIHHLEALAEYYGVSTDYLLGRTDEPKPYPASSENISKP